MKVGFDGTRRLRLLSSGAVENRMDVVVLDAILGNPYLQNRSSDIQLDNRCIFCARPTAVPNR